MKKILLSTILLAISCMEVAADVDPDFYVYLCFGQSNMEGNAQPEAVDKQTVDPRFQMLATCEFSSPKRTTGQWYTAKCPIVNPWGGLGMADYFGRTMVAALPHNVKVGVVDVAIGGIAIEGFMSDKIAAMLKKAEAWQAERIRAYGSDPYKRLVDMGKVAQESGVIKGILLHQGCSNCNDPNWPNNVKKIYQNILKDLDLKAEDVPLFVGEVLYKDQGGGCSDHNNQVKKMPSVVKTSHIVYANGCPGNGVDPWHFSAAGYRTMGKRYAYEALKVLGIEPKVDESYSLPNYLKNLITPKSFDTEVTKKANATVALELWCTFKDGHKEDLTREATFTSSDFTITNGKIKMGKDGKGGVVTATYTDFLGEKHEVAITYATPNYTDVKTIKAGGVNTDEVYDLSGRRVKKTTSGLYIVNGKKVVVK